MTAATDSHFVKTHPGTDLAVKAERIDKGNTIWLEIHRVAGIQDLSEEMFLYRTDCDRLFILFEPARPLSSGFLGAKCRDCWKHLPVEARAA